MYRAFIKIRPSKRVASGLTGWRVVHIEVMVTVDKKAGHAEGRRDILQIMKGEISAGDHQVNVPVCLAYRGGVDAIDYFVADGENLHLAAPGLFGRPFDPMAGRASLWYH